MGTSGQQRGPESGHAVGRLKLGAGVTSLHGSSGDRGGDASPGAGYSQAQPGAGSEAPRVRCRRGVWRGGMLSQDLSEGWCGTRLVPGSVPPMAVWLQLYVIG